MIASFFFTAAHAITISTAIPGSSTISTSSSPGAFIANFYQFALIIAGVIAFGVIVYGGIRYMTSAGNPSGASEGKEWIEAALLGLLLLAGAYFILKVINPQLIDLNLPNLTAANVSSTASAPANSCGACGGTCNGTCNSGYYCQVSVSGGNSCLPQTNCTGPYCGGASGGAGAGGGY